MIEKYGTFPNDVYFTNHLQQGSTFATDVNNDCIYEEENNLLGWLTSNQVDEINLYNVAHILQNAKKTLVDGTNTRLTDLIQTTSPTHIEYGWIPTTANGLSNTNMMLEHETAEFHLMRFISKTQHTHGVDVNVILSWGRNEQSIRKSDVEKFYLFSEESGGQTLYPLRRICDNYRELLQDITAKRSGNPDIDYITYEDASILVHPRDGKDRISYLDKMLIDLYNYYIFNYRATHGLIQPSPNACSQINATGCNKTFKNILFEWEWFNKKPDTQGNSINVSDYYPDVELDQLIEVKEFAECIANDSYLACEPKLFTVANYFDRPSSQWSNVHYTPQQRANLIDLAFDRIYLYSYHKNPCSCYTGQATPTHYNDFSYKVGLLKNNNFGAISGPNGMETDVYPVFSAERFDDGNSIANGNFRWSALRHYEGAANNQTIGCNSADGSCDYCNDYSGRFFQDFVAYTPPSGAVTGNTKKMGFVENIFQHQYDLDPATAANTSFGQNHINGYSWFKSSMLRANSITGKTNLSTDIEEVKDLDWAVYPNPSNGLIQLDYSLNDVSRILVYSVEGEVVFERYGLQQEIDLSGVPSGFYYLSIITYGQEVKTRKFILK